MLQENRNGVAGCVYRSHPQEPGVRRPLFTGDSDSPVRDDVLPVALPGSEQFSRDGGCEDGAGLFSRPINSPIELPGVGPDQIDPTGLLTRDFDGDSILDVVVTLRNRPPALLRGLHDGSGLPLGTFTMEQPQIGSLPSAFTVSADLDEDGLLELAAVYGYLHGPGRVTVYGPISRTSRSH